MINKDILREILVEYKDQFAESLWPVEKYKWEAVRQFQDNWDIDADASRFSNMIKNSLSKTGNLLLSRSYFPIAMISGFAKSSPEEVRELFKVLFDENKNLYDRVEHFKQNAEEEILIHCCTPEIFAKLKSIVKEKYPEYVNDFNDVFSNNKCTLFNMFFCKKKLFDSYCEWLFDILFEMEKYVDFTHLDEYQKRLYGFLSERLLNVWVKHNKLKAKHLNIINIEMGFWQRIQLIRRRITNQIIFMISKW